MKSYKCIVERNGVTGMIIVHDQNAEWARSWLELEGYRVYSIEEIS